MRKNTSTWLAGLMLLGWTLAYVKWQMASNRKMVSHDMDRVVSEDPTKIATQSISRLEHPLTTNALAPASQSQQTQTQSIFDAVLDVAAKAGQQADQVGLRLTELSDEEEINLGRRLDKDILRALPQSADSDGLLRLEALLKPLAEQSKRKRIQYNVRLVESSDFNAFSCAGGYVYVTTAFLKRFSVDEELAMVLGHEIGHIELKHAVHKVQYLYQGQKALGDLAAVGQIVYSVLSSPYKKQEEFEADSYGFDVCRKAGWEPAKLLRTFERFIKLEQEQTRGRPEAASESNSDLDRRLGDYFSAHPATAERLARLKAKVF
jgi:predicted Zn-dependent protease